MLQAPNYKDFLSKLDQLVAENRAEAEIDEFKEAQTKYILVMLATGALTFLMIVGLFCRNRAVYYLIPWVLLVDKVFEYPLEYDLLTTRQNMIFLTFSQAQPAILTIVLFACNNFIEASLIFWILIIRGADYAYKISGDELPIKLIVPLLL